MKIFCLVISIKPDVDRRLGTKSSNFQTNVKFDCLRNAVPCIKFKDFQTGR